MEPEGQTGSEVAASYPHLVFARLNESIQPIDRGERYEDPLQEALKARDLGEVTGGGSELGADFQIVHVDLELGLKNLENALDAVKEKLEALGAPIGSELQFEVDGQPRSVPFGTMEGLAVHLDGVTLPKKVYKELDFEAVYQQLDKAVKASGGEARDVWSGPTETAIQFFGPSAAALAQAIQALHPSIPVLQNARLLFLEKGKPEERREVRLPFHPGTKAAAPKKASPRRPAAKKKAAAKKTASKKKSKQPVRGKARKAAARKPAKKKRATPKRRRR